MSSSNSSKLSMKVMMNKEKSKVLFAEASSDVADVLLSFLTLPLGKIVRILEQHYGDKAPVIGSLTTLYKGLVNLDSTHFCVEGAKQMLVDPTSSFQLDCRRLKLDISGSQHIKLYYCEDKKCRNSRASNVSMYCDIAKCDCGKPLNREVLYVVKEDPVNDGDGGVFMVKTASFIISDDLRVVPVVHDYLQMLKNLGITDTDGAEMSILSIDINDVIELFMHSLISSCPLTELVIKKNEKSSTAAKPEPSCFSNHTKNRDSESRSKILKVYLQKSTNKFLLAVATDEFVEFLFSLLAVPLGGVEYLLGGKTCLNNIDNLYMSLIDVIDSKYIASSNVKNKLMNPKLPHGYTFKNQVLPLNEETAPKLRADAVGIPSFKSIKGLEEGSFVKEGTSYIVRDDLTVTPFSITSSISISNSLGISLSDVTSKDLQIGVDEALCILDASLSSKTPLTDVLINPMLNTLSKRPKLEP